MGKVPSELDRKEIAARYAALSVALGDHATRRAFLLWRAQAGVSPDKFDKIPFDPDRPAGKYGSPRLVARYTLAEALDRMLELGLDGLTTGGVGVVPFKAGLIGGDLDRCREDGELVAWAGKILGGSGIYRETSPSGRGVRFLMLAPPDPDGTLPRMTGGEINGVGLYGPDSQKFITLTGLDTAGLVKFDAKVLDRAMAHMAEARNAPKGSPEHRRRLANIQAHGDTFSDGLAGAEEALSAIREGLSLHPAMLAYATRMAMDVPITEVRETLMAAYQASPLRQTDPARWWARAGSVDGVIRWIMGQGRYKRDPIPTQKIEAARKALEAHQRRVEARGTPISGARQEVDPTAAVAPMVAPDVATWAYKDGVLDPAEGAALCEAFGMGHAELAELEQVEVDMLRAGLAAQRGEAPEGDLAKWLADESERERALAEALAVFRASEENDPERHRWMLEQMPGHFTRRMAEWAADAMAVDMPGAAAMTSLAAMSAIAANRFYSRIIKPDGKFRDTALNLYAVVAAPTASGKEALFQFIQDVAELGGAGGIRNPTSSKALHRMLKGYGSVSMVVDEFAHVLEANKKDQSGHKTDLDGFMLSLYGAGLSRFLRKPYAQAKDDLEPLAMPYLVTFGTTTGEKLAAVLSADVVTDGTANRSLILDASKGMGERRSLLWSERHDRDALLSDLRLIFWEGAINDIDNRMKVYRRQSVEGSKIRELRQLPIIIPPKMVLWIESAAKQLKAAIDNPALDKIADRFTENAIKVAVLLRIGDFVPHLLPQRDEDPKTPDHLLPPPMEVGERQVDYAIRFMTQVILETVGRLRSKEANGAADETLQAIRKGVARLMAKPDSKEAKTRGGDLLAHGLVSLATLMRYARGVKLYERKAVADVMVAMGWLRPATDAEVKAALQGKRPPSGPVFWVEPALLDVG